MPFPTSEVQNLASKKGGNNKNLYQDYKPNTTFDYNYGKIPTIATLRASKEVVEYISDESDSCSIS
jgi:hypothetical protein